MRHSPGRYSQPSIRGVCFDLDGVLIETMPLHARAWSLAARQFGLIAPRQDIYLWEGESGIVTAQTLLQRAGRPTKGPNAKRLLLEKERLFRNLAGRVHVYSSLIHAALMLRAAGLKLALVTGTSSGELHRVVPKKALNPFHAILTGDQMRRGKPDAEPYRRSFKELGVQSKNACVIENAPYGIASARRAQAGWIIGLASSLPKRFLSQAHQIVSNRRQLRTILLELARTRGRH